MEIYAKLRMMLMRELEVKGVGGTLRSKSTKKKNVSKIK
jgi:hypothetical protein